MGRRSVLASILWYVRRSKRSVEYNTCKSPIVSFYPDTGTLHKPGIINRCCSPQSAVQQPRSMPGVGGLQPDPLASAAKKAAEAHLVVTAIPSFGHSFLWLTRWRKVILSYWYSIFWNLLRALMFQYAPSSSTVFEHATKRGTLIESPGPITIC